MSEFTSEGSQAADEEVKHVQAEPDIDPTTPSGLPDATSRPDPQSPDHESPDHQSSDPGSSDETGA